LRSTNGPQHSRTAGEFEQFGHVKHTKQMVEAGWIIRGDGLAANEGREPPRFELAQRLVQRVSSD